MVDATKVILVKKETTYETDAAPTGLANAVLTRNFSSTPIEVDALERNLDVPTRGGSAVAITNKRQRMSFEVELAGSGAAGTAAAWMELLEICGMAAPTLTAGTKAEQKMAAIGAALSSGTIHHWHANQKKAGLGARGTYGWNFTASAYPFLTLELTALVPSVNPISAAAAPAPDFTRWKAPVEVNTANTDFTLDGFALVLKSFTGEIGAGVGIRNLVGSNYVNRGNHAITGRIVGELPDLAAKNYWTSLTAGAHVAVNLIHGVTAGNIVEITSGNLQITGIGLSEEDDIMMVDIAYRLNVVAGQDDILITAK